jgi:hypothetical protein
MRSSFACSATPWAFTGGEMPLCPPRSRGIVPQATPSTKPNKLFSPIERMTNLKLTLLLAIFLVPFAHAQTIAGGRNSRPLITARIDETQLQTLAGNTRPQANALNDRGPVPDSLAMEHMLLQLRRPAEQEQALSQLIDQLHTRGSSNYHHWLTPAQFGNAYGPAQQDITAVTGWLQSRGFKVNQVHPSGMLVDFSGTAGQVRGAFHTDIHYLDAGGESHIANMSDPQIPAALAPAGAGGI